MRRYFFSAVMISIIVMTLSGCSNAGSSYSDGRNNFVNGNYENAAQCFEAAIKENPNRADYYIDYGMTLIELARYQDALDQFDHAYMDKDMLIIRQNNKRVLRGKGIAYYHMLRYDDAIQQFKLALENEELSYLDMDILYYMADALKTIGSYEDAIKAYSDIIDIDGKAAMAYNRRAGCYKSMGDYEKGITDYDSAIALEPKNYECYFGKYYLMAEEGNKAGAAEVLTQAEKITPVTSEDNYNLAKVHFYKGNYDQALSELSTGYAGGFLEAYYYIGEINRLQKDYEKAAYYYQCYIDNGEISSSNVYNQIAVCKMKLGNYEDALKYLEQGLAHNNAETLQILKKNEIAAYENLGRFSDAQVKLREYLAGYPEDEAAVREADFIQTRVMASTGTDITE